MGRRVYVFAGALIAACLLGVPTVAAAPSPLVWSGTASFGTITSGGTASQQFTLSNPGGKASGALKTSLSGSTAYSIKSDSCNGTSVGKGKSCVVTVQYAPTTPSTSDTATLSAASKQLGAASINLSGAASAPACSGTPTTRLQPSSGQKDAGTLTVDASQSTDPCGRPLSYFWGCSGSEPGACTTFQTAAATGGVTSYSLPLIDGDMYFIAVQACVTADTANCGVLVKAEYEGVATF
jgi:hypothetical protein